MSVITTFPATPNRMRIVWSYVGRARQGSIQVEELQRLLGPKALQARQSEDEGASSGKTIGDDVVTEMCNLGLLEHRDDGSVAIGPNAPNGDDAAFLAYLENRLLEPEEADRHGQKSFPLALAWFLIQDPATPLQWGQNYSKRVEDDCGVEIGSFELSNHSRFEQFVYWARYLGFAWRLESREANVVFPDPTNAIVRHMPKVMGGNGRHPIQEVLPEIARLLPVLEGGTARAEVEALLPPNRQLPDGHISRSTSFALERLDRQEMIRMDRVDDAPALNLDRSGAPRAVSHITWHGEK